MGSLTANSVATNDLTPHVQGIEAQLLALDDALARQDTALVDGTTLLLHKALADAMHAFRDAQAKGAEPLSPELRRRLLLAQARVTQLQQVLHTATSSLERSLQALLPPEAAAVPADRSSTGPQTPVSRDLNAYRS